MTFFQETEELESPTWRVRFSSPNPWIGIEEPDEEGIEIVFDQWGRIASVNDEESFFLAITLVNDEPEEDEDGNLPPRVGGLTTEEGMTFMIDFSRVTQVAGKTDVEGRRMDGNEYGKLSDWAIDADGVLQLVYTNGMRENFARLALANFANDMGLTKVSDTTFMESNNSGAAVINIPNTGDFGKIIAYGIEMSNVDLATEFTYLVTTQRGYQANARVISTSDEILQELVNIKR
jgi:flagellar hook-basal body protein